MMDNMFRKKEIVIFILTFILLIAPYIVQVIATPSGKVATGFLTGGPDYMTFITKMNWGSAGHWSYQDRYTSEPTEAVPIYWFYLLLGHLAAFFNISLPVTYHLAVAILGGLAVTLLWRFVGYYSKYPLIALFLSIFASGGILDFIDNIFKTDLSHLDGFLQGHIYLALRAFPHYAVDLIAMLLIYHAYLKESLTTKYIALLAAVGGLLISAVHPFLLALVPVTLIHATLVNRAAIKKALFINFTSFMVASPLTLLLAHAMMHVFWLNEWRNQTALITPPNPFIFLLAIYGLAGVIGWMRAFKDIRHKKPSFWSVWLFTASIMAYLVPMQSRYEFTFFLSLPLGMLAADWLGGFIDRLNSLKAHKTARIYLSIVIVLLFIWPALIYVPGVFMSSVSSNKYLPVSYINVLKSMDEVSRFGDVATSMTETGNVIPAYTYNIKPYVGHPLETLNYEHKKEKVDLFFKGKMNEKTAREFLKESNTRWVIFDRVLPGESGDYKYLLELFGKPFYDDEFIMVWDLEALKEGVS